MNEQLKIIISAEIDKLKQNLEEGKRQVQSFGEKTKEAMGKAKDALSKGASVAGTAIKGIAGGITAVAGAVVGLVASTAEYNENQAKLKSAFESAGASADTAKQVYNDLYRVLGEDDTAVEASAHLAQLTTDQASLSEWTNICQGVYATFGDSLPIESLTEASNETAKTGQLTGALADALNWAGISEEEFQAKIDACNSEAERESLIRNTLNGVYDNASKKYEENNKEAIKQKEAQAKLNETLGKLGKTLTPIITKFTEIALIIAEKASPYIEKFADWILPKVEPAFNAIVKAIQTAIQWVKDLINWFKNLKDKAIQNFENLKEKITTIIDKIKGIFTFDWSLPKPKLPHFNVSGGEAPWGFMGKGSLPKVKIEWYAKGGVFDNPTFFGMGEAGAEAIVPLENNLEWLDKLAGMLNDRMGGNQPIVLKVDGKTLAQVSCDSINSLTKQRGSIPLVLA